MQRWNYGLWLRGLLVYGYGYTRFKGSDASVAVPASWKPAFRAEGEAGNAYLANLYVGAAEVVAT